MSEAIVGFVVVCHEKLLCLQRVHPADSLIQKSQTPTILVAQAGGGRTLPGLALVTVLTEVMVSQVHAYISIQL